MSEQKPSLETLVNSKGVLQPKLNYQFRVLFYPLNEKDLTPDECRFLTQNVLGVLDEGTLTITFVSDSYHYIETITDRIFRLDADLNIKLEFLNGDAEVTSGINYKECNMIRDSFSLDYGDSDVFRLKITFKYVDKDKYFNNVH
jgi:hypothetical protein